MQKYIAEILYETPHSVHTCKYATKKRFCHLDFQYVPYHAMKRPVSRCDMTCFSHPNALFWNIKRHVLQRAECQVFT